MTRKKKGPAKFTTAPSCGSSEQEIAAISLRDRCLEQLRRVAEDAQNFKIRLFHASEDWETRAWSMFPTRKTEWMRQSADSIRTYVEDICEIFLDVNAAANETKKSIPLFRVHLDALFTIIRQIFERAGEGASSHEDDEKRWDPWDVERRVQELMAECRLEIVRTIRVAFDSAKIWIAREVDRRAQANRSGSASKLPPKKLDLSRYTGRIEAANLTDIQREVFLLRIQHGMSFRSIGSRLYKDESTIRECYKAAIEKISGVHEV